MQREIVRIDEEKCDGCGLCVPSCAEGAIQILDGKARLIAENLCDGFGACLGECPHGAIAIEQREASAFDEAAVAAHLGISAPSPTPEPASCPSSRLRILPTPTPANSGRPARHQAGGNSELRQWPIQMHLLPTTAPFFQGADLLLAADCVPFAYANFHGELLAGKTLVIGCPKLDDGDHYRSKLTQILKLNQIRSLTIAHMEVPCCFGLIHMAQQALTASGSSAALTTINIGVDGRVILASD